MVMPNIKSAEKRVKVSENKRVVNKAYKTSMKNKTKAVLLAINENKTVEEVQQLFIKAQSAIKSCCTSSTALFSLIARRTAFVLFFILVLYALLTTLLFSETLTLFSADFIFGITKIPSHFDSLTNLFRC